MGWNEFWDWTFSDSDDSFYEHLEKEYGEDAPILHAILDTAVDTAIGAVPIVGQVYSVANAKDPTIKEVKDVIWEDRHEILAVGSAVPVVGTVVSAVDATLHAAESVENNVEFFIEGATGEDEPIYDENGNIIGYKDKWMTDKMQRKAKYAESHGANAALGAVMTMSGANYAKGGKAVVTASKKGGGFVEKLFTKRIDKASDAVATNAAKRSAADAAFHESANTVRSANTAAREAASREAKARATSADYIVSGMKETTKAGKEAAASDAKLYSEIAGLERLSKEAAEREATAASQQAVKAAAERETARVAEEAARKEWEQGIRAIDALRASNNLRTFLTTSVTIGLATVSEYNKNIERFGVSDDYKAPAIPYIND